MHALLNADLKIGASVVVHKFEAAGLGKAPFRFTGQVEEQHGSSCDYCGTALRYEFWVESADGRKFKVGCDCIRKTGDQGLIKCLSTAAWQIEEIKRERAQEAKERKVAEQKATLQAQIRAISETLASQPHPYPHPDHPGTTLLDYVNLCLANGFFKKVYGVLARP